MFSLLKLVLSIVFRLLEAVGYSDKKFALVIDGSSLRHAFEGNKGNYIGNVKREFTTRNYIH